MSNHPLGWAGWSGTRLCPGLLLWYAKVEIYGQRPADEPARTGTLCIPINKTGKQAKDFPRMVEAGFASDNQLIMFPAACSMQQNGVIRDLGWKKTFIVKELQAHRDVVSVHFGAEFQLLYNLANFFVRCWASRFNIAMLYLADEMLENRHKTFTITIGNLSPETFDKSKARRMGAICERILYINCRDLYLY